MFTPQWHIVYNIYMYIYVKVYYSFKVTHEFECNIVKTLKFVANKIKPMNANIIKLIL